MRITYARTTRQIRKWVDQPWRRTLPSPQDLRRRKLQTSLYSCRSTPMDSKYSSTAGETLAGSMKSTACDKLTNKYEWKTGLKGISSPRKFSNQAIRTLSKVSYEVYGRNAPILGNEEIRVATCICDGFGSILENEGSDGGCWRIHSLKSASFAVACMPESSIACTYTGSLDRDGFSAQMRSTRFCGG